MLKLCQQFKALFNRPIFILISPEFLKMGEYFLHLPVDTAKRDVVYKLKKVQEEFTPHIEFHKYRVICTRT